MNNLKDAFHEFYKGNNYWVGVLGATIIVVTAPIVIPTRIIYRTYKAVKCYGL